MPFPVPHLVPGCPWYELSELGRPNIKWCEATKCAWITEPANTWSNLAYLLAAIYFYIYLRKTENLPEAKSSLQYFAPAAAIVGVTSFVHHMSYSFILQTLDFFGMYVFCFLIITLNLRRLAKLELSKMVPFFWKAVISLTAVTVILAKVHFPIQSIVLILILGIIGSEILAAKKTENEYSPRYFFMAIAVLFSGAVFSFLDASRIWCAPDNHYIQGHAIWHVLSAMALVFLFYHYRLNCPTSVLMSKNPL